MVKKSCPLIFHKIGYFRGFSGDPVCYFCKSVIEETVYV